MPRVREAKLDAQHKAIDALARYKFIMFGYWAAIWTYLNNLDDHKDPSPFALLVQEARKLKFVAGIDQQAEEARELEAQRMK